jgi:hypothetical protein
MHPVLSFVSAFSPVTETRNSCDLFDFHFETIDDIGRSFGRTFSGESQLAAATLVAVVAA